MSFEEFEKNQSLSPMSVEEAAKHAGGWVAWNYQGTRILASGNSIRTVRELLLKQNLDPASTVISYVPKPDESVIL